MDLNFLINNFKNNKYTSWYFKIIQNAKNRQGLCVTEKHHIVPRSFFKDKNGNKIIINGLSEPDVSLNIVRLTPREHFICHLLLLKMTEGYNYQKMLKAVWMFQKKNFTNSKLYHNIRKKYLLIPRSPMSEATKRKISVANTGKRRTIKTRNLISFARKKSSVPPPSRTGTVHTEQTKLKISQALQNKPKSIQHKNAISRSKIGHAVSTETRLKMSKARRNYILNNN